MGDSERRAGGREEGGDRILRSLGRCQQDRLKNGENVSDGSKRSLGLQVPTHMLKNISITRLYLNEDEENNVDAGVKAKVRLPY